MQPELRICGLSKTCFLCLGPSLLKDSTLESCESPPRWLPEPSEVGMDAEVGAIHLDALAVDLDNCSSGRHILRESGGAASGLGPAAAIYTGPGRGQLLASLLLALLSRPKGSSSRILGLGEGRLLVPFTPLTEFSLYSGYSSTSRSCFCSAKPNSRRLEKTSVSSIWSRSER